MAAPDPPDFHGVQIPGAEKSQQVFAFTNSKISILLIKNKFRLCEPSLISIWIGDIST